MTAGSLGGGRENKDEREVACNDELAQREFASLRLKDLKPQETICLKSRVAKKPARAKAKRLLSASLSESSEILNCGDIRVRVRVRVRVIVERKWSGLGLGLGLG